MAINYTELTDTQIREWVKLKQKIQDLKIELASVQNTIVQEKSAIEANYKNIAKGEMDAVDTTHGSKITDINNEIASTEASLNVLKGSVAIV